MFKKFPIFYRIFNMLGKSRKLAVSLQTFFREIFQRPSGIIMIKVVAETCSHSKSRGYIVAYSPRYLIKEYKFEKAVWHVTRIGNHLLCKHALLSKSDHTITDFLSCIPSHGTLEFKGNTDKPGLDLVLYWLKYKTFCSSNLMKWKYLRFSNFFNRKIVTR